MNTVHLSGLPAWTYAGTSPSVYTFFEAIALVGFEECALRLDATTQRALLGYPVFGRRQITVHKSGTVSSIVTTAFGRDYEETTYTPSTVASAARAKKQLRPGFNGPKYFSG